ncbi:MAG: hypothetical protein ACHQVK_02255, partial [Candidatus Paceibacterales bacterium]
MAKKSLIILVFAFFGILIFLPSTSLAGICYGGNCSVNCIPNASRQCISNIAYWYDSCGAVQSIYQNCGAMGQACQSGNCVGTQPVYNNPPVYNNQPTYIKNYTKSCYNNNVYW